MNDVDASALVRSLAVHQVGDSPLSPQCPERRISPRSHCLERPCSDTPPPLEVCVTEEPLLAIDNCCFMCVRVLGLGSPVREWHSNVSLSFVDFPSPNSPMCRHSTLPRSGALASISSSHCCLSSVLLEESVLADVTFPKCCVRIVERPLMIPSPRPSSN